MHGYGNNDSRRVKTDKKDSVKLENYGLDRWLTLPKYVPVEDTRLLLKNCYRQYRQYSKVQTVLKNNPISLLDTVFPNVNRLFSSPMRGDGSEKWVDFVVEFWHSINTLMLNKRDCLFGFCNNIVFDYFCSSRSCKPNIITSSRKGWMPTSDTVSWQVIIVI